jgi:hypothetical protein
MSDAPEWVDDPPEGFEQTARINERQITIESVSAAIQAALSALSIVQHRLISLDEMGCAVSRSKTRAAKSLEVVTDLKAHYDYDVVQGKYAGTKEQQARAERYELS